MLLAAVTACAGSPHSPPPTTSTGGRSTESATATATGSPEHPIGVVAVGHSGMTGYMSGPRSPGTDTEANSWATGTNPAVRSIYQRLVEVRPETAGHVANAASDGAASDRLPDQATEGLTRVPHPALLLVQILGNDLRCDGTDPQHYPEFRDNVRTAVQTVLKASPNASVVLSATQDDPRATPKSSPPCPPRPSPSSKPGTASSSGRTGPSTRSRSRA
jgi:hypothetical protein